MILNDPQCALKTDFATLLDLNKVKHNNKRMTAAGYTVSPKSKQYHALDSFVYEYQNAGGMKDNLKISNTVTVIWENG